jgi:hypothetical protein
VQFVLNKPQKSYWRLIEATLSAAVQSGSYGTAAILKELVGHKQVHPIKVTRASWSLQASELDFVHSS